MDSGRRPTEVGLDLVGESSDVPAVHHTDVAIDALQAQMLELFKDVESTDATLSDSHNDQSTDTPVDIVGLASISTQALSALQLIDRPLATRLAIIIDRLSEYVRQYLDLLGCARRVSTLEKLRLKSIRFAINRKRGEAGCIERIYLARETKHDSLSKSDVDAIVTRIQELAVEAGELGDCVGQVDQ